jgi:hypothetical protein
MPEILPLATGSLSQMIVNYCDDGRNGLHFRSNWSCFRRLALLFRRKLLEALLAESGRKCGRHQLDVRDKGPLSDQGRFVLDSLQVVPQSSVLAILGCSPG